MAPKLYKAVEVCELLKVQPYVLRSWEKEFPGIGIQKGSDSPRLYRQSDVDHVQRIKQLVFVEGLTVAGARRRLEDTAPLVSVVTDAEAAEVIEALGDDVRARIALVRDGLRKLQAMLANAPGKSNGNGRAASSNARRTEFRLKPPSPKPARAKASTSARRVAPRSKPVMKRAVAKPSGARKKVTSKRKHARA